ncbi:MAG: ECF-type sigma factor [Planctomycetota bacterium]
MTRYRLIPIALPKLPAYIEIAAEGVTVGRDLANAICLAGDEHSFSSAVHARIVFDAHGAPFIEDLKSKNATLVNSQAIERAALQIGDIIQFGRGGARFQLASDESPCPPLPDADIGLPNSGTLTTMFAALRSGDSSAEEKIFATVYEELRQMARNRLKRERGAITLQATALVNETYLRLVGNDSSWENRRHFFASAARAMWQILVDRARRKNASRHGGKRAHVKIDDLDNAVAARQGLDPADLLALDEALEKLSAVEARQAQVVRYRFLLGLTASQTAELLGVTVRTIDSDWQQARAWLRRELGDSPGLEED